MATDAGGVVDDVQAELNPDPNAPSGLGPDAKGPDPEQWSEEKVAERDNSEFVPGDEGVVKGPDPAQWGDEARAERGADGEGVPSNEDALSEPSDA